ncbi:PepSY-like domain-containing protein [uncultured Bacteroides sp.]|uniref:PepSY-like domain-containing protein n=1 Tax=uncultured Bacteroides sp. TaxID=162156 RepID=UPI0025D1A49A|nr:PepSY-like domain-containing protein [uncultured Bacteroides sp.]
MKRKFSFLFFSLVAMLFMAACSDDDDKKDPDYQPGTAVQTSFKQMFPNATNVLWSEKDDYGVANFLNSSTQTAAWFNQDGVWYLTETAVATNAIPKVITDAIANSDYKTWKVVDASHLERKDMIPAYVVELTQNGKVVDLYYAEDGYLFLVAGQDNTGNEAQPTPVEQPVLAMVKQQYASAKIVKVETGDNINVTLVDNNVYFLYILSKSYTWVQSEYSQSWADTPQAVKDGLTRDKYAFNELVDTVTKVIRPQANGTITLYRINMDNSTGHITVYYNADGTQVEG